jgi:hypothetical protein
VDTIWSPEPGQPLVLSLDAQSDGIRVRIVSRQVAPAHETPLQKFLYTPLLWASTVAGVAVIVLLSSAFASGAIRPAPPPAPTARPGEPTSTPDARPAISVGGMQLVAPILPTDVPPTATPVPGPAQLQLAVAEATPEPTPAPPQQSCAFLVFGCNPQPAPKPQPVRAQPQPQQSEPAQAEPPAPQEPQPSQEQPLAPLTPEQRVLPVASPAARRSEQSDFASRDTGPRPGTNLDMALRIASIASDTFNRSLQEDTEGSGQSPSVSDPSSSEGPSREKR